MRYRINLSYKGAPFCGWQRQNDAPSVQQSLEDALGVLLRCPVSVTGAGRTDTGVNAIGYTAHFDAPQGTDTAALTRKLNAILPDAIVITDICVTEADFHSRFDARLREYTYYLHRSKDPFVESYSYRFCYPSLDVSAMNRAAEYLVGQHDFSSFEKAGSDNKTSICTVYQALWETYTPVVCAHGGALRSSADSGASSGIGGSTSGGIGGSTSGGTYLKFTISADRFLRNMVRAIVGTLLEVGRGKRTAESVAALLEERDRCSAGESVPGHALFLTRVEY